MRVGDDDSTLFLPRVPLDEGWGLETTSIHLSRNAGLAGHAWQRRDALSCTGEGE